MVQERNLRRALLFAAFGGGLMLYGIITDFEPLTGIGLAGMLISLIGVFVLIFLIRPLRQTLDDMVTGNRYIHWTYSPDFWEGHLRRERRRKKLEIGKYLAIGSIPATLLALLMGGLAYWAQKNSLGTSLLYGGIGFCAMVVLFGIVGAFADLYRWLRFLELKRLGGQVILGPTGLYYSGDLFKSRWHPRYLSVEWGEKDGLSHLLFKFEVRVKNGYYIEEVLIPVPPGKEVEARNAMQKVLQSW
ncbi:MAG TPA: hypothetical protein VJP40_01325 [bacterium]|nr:hypothetical protein [bacterium]